VAYTFDGTSTDHYQELQCPGAVSVTVLVSDNPIAINYGIGGNGRPGAAVYPPGDEILLPTTGGYARACDAIRFKSRNVGQPASVQIAAIPGPPPTQLEL
jgi:hypothetical protein